MIIKEKKDFTKENNEKVEINKTIENTNEKKNVDENKELIIKDNGENIDEIIIQYIIDNIEYSTNIKIFGDIFVKNNKDKCRIIINGNEFELNETLNVNNNQLKNKIFEIKLKGIKNITNISYIFSGCESLSSLPDISKWNTQNLKEISDMFSGCNKKLKIPKNFKAGCFIF